MHTWEYLGLKEGDPRVNAYYYRLGCGCILWLYARSEESVLSSRLCLKIVYTCMHEYNHFIIGEIGCFVETIQSPCGPGAYILAEKGTRKRTQI